MTDIATRLALVVIGIALGIGVVSSYITISEMESKLDYVYKVLKESEIVRSPN